MSFVPCRGKNILKQIKLITQSLLLGFEITDFNENSCTLENISEPESSKYEVILRKTFLIIKDDLDLIKQDLVSGKFENSEEILDSRSQQDQFVLFCRRLLTKEKYEKNTNLQLQILFVQMKTLKN